MERCTALLHVRVGSRVVAAITMTSPVIATTSGACLSPLRGSFPLVLIYLSEGDPRNPGEAKYTGGPSGKVYASSLHERTTIVYPNGDASSVGM